MLKAYQEPIMTAVWLFPLIAGLFTLPYCLVQYRRFGAIPLLRSVVIYSFILYMMCAYFLTILPLPPRAEVAKYTTERIQLIPFREACNWIKTSNVVLSAPSTWKGLLNSALFQIIANIALTVPFGMYMRYYFGYSLKKTVFLSFCLSLFYELSQLSGLFFIYPRPYRLCDVDDLMTNTLGGLLGYFAVAPLLKFLPSHERMDAVAYQRGQHVSLIRRGFAAVLDWIIMGVLTPFIVYGMIRVHLIYQHMDLTRFASAGCIGYILLILLMAVPCRLFGGRTVGHALLKIRLVDTRTGKCPRLWQCFVRYFTLYGLLFPVLPFLLAFLATSCVDKSDDTMQILLMVGVLALYAFFMLFALVQAISKKGRLLHGEWSRTDMVSTLKNPENQ